MRVTVFCGSRNGNDPKFGDMMYEFGKRLAHNRHTLVYGGSSVGLMGRIAAGTLDNGGKVIGVFPRDAINPEEKEALAHPHFRFMETKDMQERKKELVRNADVVVLAPGGWGSLDEIFEVLTLNQIGVTNLMVGILNIDGYYDALMKLFDDMITAGFVAERHRKWYKEVSDIDALFDKVIEY